MNSLTECLVCECNGRTYPSITSLKAHRKTKIHEHWELNKTKKNNEIDLNRFQNKIDHLERVNMLLLERINELEALISLCTLNEYK